MRRSSIICLLLSVAFCATIKSLNEDIAVLKRRSVVTNNNFLVEDKKQGAFEDTRTGRLLKRAVSQTMCGSTEERLMTKESTKLPAVGQKERPLTDLQPLQEGECLGRAHSFGYQLNSNGQTISQKKEEADLKEALQQKEIECATLQKNYEAIRIALQK